MSDVISTRREGMILEVTLDRPKANAIDLKTSRLMGETFKAFRDDPELRVAIVKTAGDKFFSAGWDLKAAASGDAVDGDYGVGGFAGLQELRDLNKPVIACVNGMAVGGGFELALSCDLIYASDHSSFALPEIKAGTLADAATIKLPKRIPYHVAMDLLLTGRWMDVAEAHRWGLVNEVLPKDKLEERVWEIARLLAGGPPLVFAAIKEVAREAEAQSFQAMMNRITRRQLATVDTLYGSEDNLEGFKAFAEKREPVWKRAMTDYSTLIDAETWAFIEKTNSFTPPDAVDMTVAEQRAVYNRMCQAFHAGHPEGLSTGTGWFEQREPHIRMRVYRPEAENAPAVVFYLHGGGFVLGGLESHDDVCAEIAARTGFDVLAVDYRLAPEHQHPAAFDDAMAVFEWLLSRSLPVLLCGDSAGGNLAAALAAVGRKNTRRALGQVLIYPGLGGDVTAGSYVKHADAPMLSTRDVLFYHDVRGAAAGDPTAAPLADTDFSDLPPTVVITAECDPLSSDGETYRDRIIAAGGKALWIEEPGLVHGYLRARHSVARARDSFTRIVNALSALGRGEWPADLARQKP